MKKRAFFRGKRCTILSMSICLVILSGLIVCLWFPRSKSHAQTNQGASATDIAWSPDGSVLAVSGDFGVSLYSSDTFQIAQIITTFPTEHVAWNRDGTLLATNIYYKESYITQIWDMTTYTVIATLSHPVDIGSGVLKLIWSQNDNQLAIVQSRGVYIYDTGTLEPRGVFTSDFPIIDASLSPDGMAIATVGGGVSSPAMLMVWETSTNTPILAINLTDMYFFYDISTLTWSNDSTQLALGGLSDEFGSIANLDLQTQTVSLGFVEPVATLGFVGWSPDGNRFAAEEYGTPVSSLYMWNATTSKLMWTKRLPDVRDSYQNAAWKPDSTQLAILANVYTDNEDVMSVYIIDADTGNNVVELERPPWASPVTLAGTIWKDMNKDGLYTSDETPMENIAVNLLDASGTIIQTTTTSDHGYYYFESQPGTYMIEIGSKDINLSPTNQGGDDTVDSDFNPSTYRTEPVSLASGEAIVMDAGVLPTVQR